MQERNSLALPPVSLLYIDSLFIKMSELKGKFQRDSRLYSGRIYGK